MYGMNEELERLSPEDFELYLRQSDKWTRDGDKWRCGRTMIPLRFREVKNTVDWKKRMLGSIALDERRTSVEVLRDIRHLKNPNVDVQEKFIDAHTEFKKESMKLNMLTTNQVYMKRRYDRLSRRIKMQERYMLAAVALSAFAAVLALLSL